MAAGDRDDEDAAGAVDVEALDHPAVVGYHALARRGVWAHLRGPRCAGLGDLMTAWLARSLRAWGSASLAPVLDAVEDWDSAWELFLDDDYDPVPEPA